MSTSELIEGIQWLALLEHDPVGLCATASVAFWQYWHARTGEQLYLCIAFEHNVAHHVFLRRDFLLLDPTGHQFETHDAHIMDLSLYPRPQHQQGVVETNCLLHFMDLLRGVCWPAEQWPTEERVQLVRLALASRQQALRAHVQD